MPRLQLVAFALGMFAVVGCGGDQRAIVSGTVTVAGKGPLTGGAISFISAADAKRAGHGTILADGTFRVVDAPVGECKVVIDNSNMEPADEKSGPPTGVKGGPQPTPGKAAKGGKGEWKASPEGEGGPPPADNSLFANRKYIKLEKGYSAPGTTPLTFLVERGEAKKDFEVKADETADKKGKKK